MTGRRTATAIALALVSALVASPALALCSAGVAEDCCCSGQGCPKSASRVKAPSCCKPGTPSPPPAVGKADRTVSPTTPSVAADLAGEPSSPVRAVYAAPGGDARRHGPRGASLYTLHAAFLI